MSKGGVVHSRTAHFVALNIVAAFLNMVYSAGIAGTMDGNLRSAEWTTMTTKSHVGIVFLGMAFVRMLILLDFGMHYIKAMIKHVSRHVMMEI